MHESSPAVPAGSAQAQRVVLAERDEAAALETTSALRFMGFDVQAVTSSRVLLALIDEGWADLVVMEVKLPEVSGLVLCGQIRARHSLPVVFYSESQRRDDPTLARMLGADEFIPKSVEAHEFRARIAAVVRRVSAVPTTTTDQLTADQYQVGNLAVDTVAHRVSVGGVDIDLTPTEYRLLVNLAARPNQVFSRSQLDFLARGYRNIPQSRAIDTHITRLRAKLRAAPEPTPQIVSVHGYGYKLAEAATNPTRMRSGA